MELWVCQYRAGAGGVVSTRGAADGIAEEKIIGNRGTPGSQRADGGSAGGTAGSTDGEICRENIVAYRDARKSSYRPGCSNAAAARATSSTAASAALRTVIEEGVIGDAAGTRDQDRTTFAAPAIPVSTGSRVEVGEPISSLRDVVGKNIIVDRHGRTGTIDRAAPGKAT